MKKRTILQILCISFLLLTVGNLYADSLYFCRSGRIRTVKITDTMPKIEKVCKYDPPSKITERVAYAMITLSLDRGRTIGIYDYSLTTTKNGEKYPCIAIKAGTAPFDATWRIKKTDPDKKYTLLFKVSKPTKGLIFYLHYNLPVGKANEIQLDFSNPKNPVKNLVGAESDKKTTAVPEPAFKLGPKISAWSTEAVKEEWTEFSIKLKPEYIDTFVGVHFKYTSGTQMLNIKSVILLDGSKQVAIDEHAGSAGGVSAKNNYFLKPKQPIKNRRQCWIKIKIQAAPTSFGDILLLLKK